MVDQSAPSAHTPETQVPDDTDLVRRYLSRLFMEKPSVLRLSDGSEVVAERVNGQPEETDTRTTAIFIEPETAHYHASRLLSGQAEDIVIRSEGAKNSQYFRVRIMKKNKEGVVGSSRAEIDKL